MTRALELGALQDPLRAKHLGAPRQDRGVMRAQERGDDAALIVAEIARRGYECERGRKAQPARINWGFMSSEIPDINGGSHARGGGFVDCEGAHGNVYRKEKSSNGNLGQYLFP
jgi:hypothetical protein